MKTYMVLNKSLQVVEYFKHLRNAKRFVVKHFDEKLMILALSGSYFGEGFHTHMWEYNPFKLVFKRHKLK